MEEITVWFEESNSSLFTMQNSYQNRALKTLCLPIFFFLFSFHLNAQTNADMSGYRNQVDSLYKVVDKLCMDDSTSKLASSWILKANTLFSILDDPDLKERYKGLDLQVEAANALIKCKALDKKGEYKVGTENSLVSSTLDLSILGREALETARKFNSPTDAEKAVELFSLCLETYKNCGNAQSLVDKFWLEDEITWQWIRFYKAVAYRKSGKPELAEKEYSTLMKLGWNEVVLFLELADLQTKNGRPEDAQKTLLFGHEKHKENLALVCALTRSFLNADQLKKAQAIIHPFDAHLGYHADLVLVKALVFERKGDFKKADALFKAVHKSDPNEVEINYEYANYLLRKAKKMGGFDAEDFAQLAYTLLHHATELSPDNEMIKSEFALVKTQYPKVTLEQSQ